jgi:hypothetical protein
LKIARLPAGRHYENIEKLDEGTHRWGNHSEESAILPQISALRRGNAAVKSPLPFPERRHSAT